ncbi:MULTISPECIES: ATP-binding protein [Hymenobacter]|uniref:histidine kinase n=1 Tax=Hymenobacter mucosus TaxID=1411120 RepID=A0A238WZM2_9BACT|nr:MULTISPECIES: ATP-binding protein [Hymenobacter]SNR51900.1 Signal transduction histidine kinase [Hymenobacter mucosus]
MLIRNKLILRFMALVITIQLCLTAFIYYYSAQARELRFYHRLEAKAEQTAHLLIHRLNLEPEVLQSFRKKDLLTMHNERISIYDPQRRLVFHLAQVPQDAGIPTQDTAYFNQITRKKPARFQRGKVETLGMLYRHQGKPYLIFVAGRDQFGGREFDTLRSILLGGNLGALVLIIGAAWYFADRSLRPLSRMVTEVKGITASNLRKRVDEGNRRDEIAHLAMTFNEMLSGLEQSFEAQKSFLSHASHELRTPLANVLGTLETASAYDTELPAAKRSIDSAVEEIQRIIDLTNGLLALAKADDTSFRRTPVQLDDVVLQAVDSCSARYPGRTVQVEFGTWPETVEAVFSVPGNAQLLQTAVLNLLDNACKYSTQTVTVALGYETPRQILLTITDTGSGLAADELMRVVEPLYRGANGRDKPGYGLGLAITQKIVQVHAGQLQIASEVGKGTRVLVRLPAL